MEWITENWIWILLIGGFLAFHLFGGGCCGRGGHQADDKDEDEEASAADGKREGTDAPRANWEAQGTKQPHQRRDGLVDAGVADRYGADPRPE